MKQFLGSDGFRRVQIDGDIYILQDLYHYRHVAVKAAQAYLESAKVRIIDSGGNQGCYGIWAKERR